MGQLFVDHKGFCYAWNIVFSALLEMSVFIVAVMSVSRLLLLAFPNIRYNSSFITLTTQVYISNIIPNFLLAELLKVYKSFCLFCIQKLQNKRIRYIIFCFLSSHFLDEIHTIFRVAQRLGWIIPLLYCGATLFLKLLLILLKVSSTAWDVPFPCSFPCPFTYPFPLPSIPMPCLAFASLPALSCLRFPPCPVLPSLPSLLSLPSPGEHYLPF